MAILSKGSRPSDSIPTSSMADIAFLLLIFFLVTTTFPKDKGLAIVLPSDSSPVSEENVMHLIVSGTGDVEIRRGASQQGQHVSTDQIGAIWREAVAENPRLIAAVKTRPDAAYRHMVDVLDQLEAAGARRVSLQMLEG
ncbi:MAG: biopolymer transporter ExbD [Gemmatimonadota bacterium]|jgi:biopolymer transport protein ExbD